MKLLVAIGGHTGTGKTTLAYNLKRECAILGNSLIIDDDAVRRNLLNVTLAKRLQDEDYSEEVSKRVVDEIERQTAQALLSERPVINSSGFFSETTQNGVENMAKESNARFIGLWLTAPFGEMKKRIKIRTQERLTLKELSLEKGHASDADEGVIDKFGSLPLPSHFWHMIDARITKEKLLSVAIDVILNELKEKC